MGELDVVIECDAAGVIRAVRGPLPDLLGYERSEVVGRPIADYLHPRNASVAGPIIATLAGRPDLELWDEVRIRRTDGGWRWFRASIRGGTAGRQAIVVSGLPLADDVASRLDAAHEVRDAAAGLEQRFHLLAEAAPIGVFRYDPEVGCTYVNPRWSEITGLSATEAIGEGWRRGIHPDDEPGFLPRAHLAGLLDAGPTRATFRTVRPDGEVRWVEVATAPVIEADGTASSLVGTVDDITEATEAIGRARRLAHVVEATTDLVGLWEVGSDRVELNAAARRFLGFDLDAESVALHELQPTLPPVLVEGWAASVLGDLDEHGTWSGELDMIDGTGATVPMSVIVIARRDERGELAGIAGVLRDLSDRKAMEARLAHEATHDPLTGLPNRVLLLDRLETALAHRRRSGHELAVLFCDLDRFKVVNDSLGHALGDRVLVALSSRLRRAVSSRHTVARFGGDEFVVLLEELEGPEEAMAITAELLEAIGRPIEVAGERFVVTASIGVTIPDDASGAEDLLRDADAAMYRAKASGRARAVRFEPSMREAALDRFAVEHTLRRALDGDELTVQLQPLVSLDDGRIAGFEALVRWDHPGRGRLLPDEFLGIAEEAGLLGDVGARVLDLALAALAQLDGARPADAAPLRMSINLSAPELSDPALVDRIAGACERHGIEPSRVDLELTEHSLMDDVEGAVRQLGRLRSAGHRVAVDDFGTGYSSLAYLRSLPLDSLKIDRTFVAGLGANRADDAIVGAIIALSAPLRLEVVAEGVEDATQLDALRALGCALVQGYHLARPLDLPAAVALVADDPRW